MMYSKEPNVSESSARSPQSALLAPQSRYVLPSFVERTSYGIKEMNPYNKLFEERIIFLGVQIDDASANDVMAQLLTLEAIDPDRDITMYINSPGGSMTSMMAIYDTMQFIQPDITTCCIGQAASAAAITKVIEMVRSTSTPSSAAIFWSCSQARCARPSAVRATRSAKAASSTAVVSQMAICL